MSPARIEDVLAITSTFPRQRGDGTPEFVLDLAEAMDVRHIRVVAPSDGHPEVASRIGTVEVCRYRYGPRSAPDLGGEAILPLLRDRPSAALHVPAFVLGCWWTTWREVRRRRPDLLHAHWLVHCGVVARLVSMVTGVPYVVSAHGADATAMSGRLGTALKRWVMRGSVGVYPVSEDIADRLRGIDPVSVREVVTMGVDAAGLRSAVESAGGDARAPQGGGVVFAGRLADKKGVDVLIDGVRRAERPLDVRVVGDGPERTALMERAAGLDSVEFIGRAERTQLLRELAAADVVVVPSVIGAGGDQDGTPVVLMEAMALGRAVVASALGGIADHVVDGENGRLVTPGDATELATVLVELSDDAEQRDRLGLAARDHALHAFDVRTLASRLLADAAAEIAVRT